MYAVCRISTVLWYDNDKMPVQDKPGLTTMPRNQGHDRREVCTYTLPAATCAVRSLAPETQREEALLPQHFQHQGALLPRHSQRERALLPQHFQHQGLAAPTPMPGTLSARYPRVDWRTRRRRTAR